VARIKLARKMLIFIESLILERKTEVIPTRMIAPAISIAIGKNAINGNYKVGR
jgi:hypothetical protein